MRTKQQVLMAMATVDAKLDSLTMTDDQDLVDIDVTDHAIGCDIVSIPGVRYDFVVDHIRIILETHRSKLEHELSHIRMEEIDGNEADKS